MAVRVNCINLYSGPAGVLKYIREHHILPPRRINNLMNSNNIVCRTNSLSLHVILMYCADYYCFHVLLILSIRLKWDGTTTEFLLDLMILIHLHKNLGEGSKLGENITALNSIERLFLMSKKSTTELLKYWTNYHSIDTKVKRPNVLL